MTRFQTFMSDDDGNSFGHLNGHRLTGRKISVSNGEGKRRSTWHEVECKFCHKPAMIAGADLDILTEDFCWKCSRQYIPPSVYILIAKVLAKRFGGTRLLYEAVREFRTAKLLGGRDCGKLKKPDLFPLYAIDNLARDMKLDRMEIVYVGESARVSLRLSEHKRRGVNFDHVLLMPSGTLTEESPRLELEAKILQELHYARKWPRWNSDAPNMLESYGILSAA